MEAIAKTMAGINLSWVITTSKGWHTSVLLIDSVLEREHCIKVM
jgi:hypothetical protein